VGWHEDSQGIAADRANACSVAPLPAEVQLNPTSAARCRLCCTVLRTIPNTTASSWELAPPPASRSICLNCLMFSLLFAGIKMSSFITSYRCQKLLTQEVMFSAENWPVFDWNGGRLQIGMVAGL